MHSALHRREEAFCAALVAHLPPETAASLDALLRLPGSGNAVDGAAAGGGAEDEQPGRAPPLLALRAGAGPARLRSVGEEADKLRRLRALGPPAGRSTACPRACCWPTAAGSRPKYAADGKQFGAWDQNLMTEWHARYSGRGIMVYWHTERKSLYV